MVAQTALQPGIMMVRKGITGAESGRVAGVERTMSGEEQKSRVAGVAWGREEHSPCYSVGGSA